MTAQQFALVSAYAADHPESARDLMDTLIRGTSDPMEVARLEVAREYLCNPEFKAGLSDYVWTATQGSV